MVWLMHLWRRRLGGEDTQTGRPILQEALNVAASRRGSSAVRYGARRSATNKAVSPFSVPVL